MKEIEIPEGYEARIEDNKVILEPKESEDEKIINKLLELVIWATPITKSPINVEMRDRCYAWLEKQKESHFTKRNALFDKCVENCDTAVMKEVSDSIDKMLEKEQKPAEDKGAIKPTPKQDYSGLTDFERAIHRGFLCAGVENVPVDIIKDTAQDCLAHIKPVEWSEEDEALLKEIVSFFKDGTTKLQHDLDLYAGFLENKLKSLRPQPHWKPSEEQMEELLNALNPGKDFDCDILAELYEQLKRL